jgi:hypothetical protein
MASKLSVMFRKDTLLHAGRRTLVASAFLSVGCGGKVEDEPARGDSGTTRSSSTATVYVSDGTTTTLPPGVSVSGGTTVTESSGVVVVSGGSTATGATEASCRVPPHDGHSCTLCNGQWVCPSSISEFCTTNPCVFPTCAASFSLGEACSPEGYICSFCGNYYEGALTPWRCGGPSVGWVPVADTKIACSP